MADEVLKNGSIEVDGDDQANENFYDIDRENDVKISELTRMVAVLEQEKADLIREYDGVKERIEELTAESEKMKSDKDEMSKKLEEMKTEIERSESDKKALEAIAARAMELETEVSRLQHDLISAMSEGDEANAEVTQLRKEVAQLKKMLEEQENLLVEIMRLKRLLEDKGVRVKNLVKENSEMGRRNRDLEEKIRATEAKVSETSEEKSRVEEETQKEIANKEREISTLGSEVRELITMIEKLKLQQEMRNNELKEASGNCAENAPDTQYEGVNGIASHSERGNMANEPLGFKWQVTILSSGTFVAAAALWYLRHRRQRLD